MPPTPISVPGTPFGHTHAFAFPSPSHASSSAATTPHSSFAYNFDPSFNHSHLNTNLSTQPLHAQKNTFYDNTPISEGEGEEEEDEEEDMDQDTNEEERDSEKEKEKANNRPPSLLPPNPTPHSFPPSATPDATAAYLANTNFYSHSLNTIPMLELDPKDEKFAAANAERQGYFFLLFLLPPLSFPLTSSPTFLFLPPLNYFKNHLIGDLCNLRLATPW